MTEPALDADDIREDMKKPEFSTVVATPCVVENGKLAPSSRLNSVDVEVTTWAVSPIPKGADCAQNDCREVEFP